MKVVAIKKPGGLENIVVQERPDPKPGAGEILIRWHATSLNYHDYLVGIGGIPVSEGRIPMSDGAGEVIGIGEGVRSFKVGDHVMSMFFPNWIEGTPTLPKTMFVSGETIDGYIAEMSVEKETAVTRVPKGYTFAEAATIPCAGLTSWRGLVVEGQIKPGDSVLIEGTGGMSIFGLQIAKAAGARVFATTSSPAKAERLKDMGVEGVVNYKEDERWGKTIFGMAGSGVDHVLDAGGGSTMHNSIEAAKIGGHIASIGILGGGRKGQITFPKLFFKHLTLRGLAVGSNVHQQDMVASIDVAGWKPIIDKSFKFDQLAAAFEYQASGAHFGKIVLEW